MADILKVTTPIVNKNQIVQNKPPIDGNAFAITELSKVVETHNQSDILKNNTGLNDNSDAPALLMNLLKDPAVAASYIKNIFMLEELFKLLPANNKTVTPEIQQMFNSLILKSEDIPDEFLKQEAFSTGFKGEIFDFLRDVSNKNKDNGSMQYLIAMTLKALNNTMNKGDILDGISNSLTYLQSLHKEGSDTHSLLKNLISGFKEESPNFTSLKEQTLSFIKDFETSLLLSPKSSKVLSIIKYNLSRYSSDPTFFAQSIYRLRKKLSNDDQATFSRLVSEFTEMYGKTSIQKSPDTSASNVMDSLINLIGLQAMESQQNSQNTEKTDKIIHSLLSSPCNFTPLLHYIIPVELSDLRAFAEIWINPNADQNDMPKDAGEGKHFLLVIEVETIGRFEVELFFRSSQNILDIHLYCPPGYEKDFEPFINKMPAITDRFDFKVGQTKIQPLYQERSLMDVFKSLPYKRVGVDVKV